MVVSRRLQQQGCLDNDTIVPTVCRWNIRALVMACVLGPMCLITDSGRAGIGLCSQQGIRLPPKQQPQAKKTKQKKTYLKKTEGKRKKTHTHKKNTGRDLNGSVL